MLPADIVLTMQLPERDLIVHVDHGIGVFVGLKQIGVGDGQQEFLELRYAGEDKLFVPVERLDLVQKYTGASKPPYSVLSVVMGTGGWLFCGRKASPPPSTE